MHRIAPDFRTYKITQQVAEVKTGRRPHVLIGNPETRRDWGHVADFVNGMWRSLQHSEPDDFVFATGESHSIRDFVELSCRIAGIHLECVFLFMLPSLFAFDMRSCADKQFMVAGAVPVSTSTPSIKQQAK